MKHLDLVSIVTVLLHVSSFLCSLFSTFGFCVMKDDKMCIGSEFC